MLSARGWPEIAFDGRVLVTHQDALLMGGKVQAMPGFADHVAFLDARLCIVCVEKTCIAMCSGQALTQSGRGSARLRARKVRPLRRMPLELRAIARWRARQH
jgi:electron-transferring-flavoprotein dehydrogenase